VTIVAKRQIPQVWSAPCGHSRIGSKVKAVCGARLACRETKKAARHTAPTVLISARPEIVGGEMKAIHFALALLSGLSVLGGLAIATSAPAAAWYCSARGTTGATGWGTAGYLATAQGIALRECAVRTPRGARCYIMFCR
jgi:hypothetical protein